MGGVVDYSVLLVALIRRRLAVSCWRLQTGGFAARCYRSGGSLLAASGCKGATLDSCRKTEPRQSAQSAREEGDPAGSQCSAYSERSAEAVEKFSGAREIDSEAPCSAFIDELRSDGNLYLRIQFRERA